MRHSRPEFKIVDSLSKLNPAKLKIALVVAKWNIDYNQEMADSAKETLLSYGFEEDSVKFVHIPGAYEMPFVSQKLLEKDHYDAVICFGTVIRGETYHFEIVANESARGIMDVMLKTSKPIINGVLTVNNEEQAKVRAAKDHDDKGKESALSLIQVLAI